MKPGADELDRFLEPQRSAYEQVMLELRAGSKRSHWMWFIFPQLRGLGVSSTSHFYGISGAAEARRYLAHPVLGARLVECTRLVLELPPRTPREVFGGTDAMKLHSCMTLFSRIAGADPAFRTVIETFYGGQPDARTLELLNSLP